MLRRHLFMGLTFVLLAIIVFLLLHGRTRPGPAGNENLEDVEKIEKIAEAAPSPTRDMTPIDLMPEVIKTSWSYASVTPAVTSAIPADSSAIATAAEAPEGNKVARHDITIHNSGDTNYNSLRLRLEYLNRSGKIVTTRVQNIGEPLPPRETLRVPELIIEGLPDNATDCRISVVSADLALSVKP